jgi:hypothetical protein
LILSTTPYKLDAIPHRVCAFTTTVELERELVGLNDAIAKEDYKAAYNLSSKLLGQYVGNTELHYLHGLVAQNLNNTPEAIETFKKASTFDCGPWRATEVYNSIIRKVAKEQQVMLFDFATLTERDFGRPVFFDEIHPQNLYYERASKQLGLVIKSILKL